MSDGEEREMSLSEWVGRLATFHRAYQEYIGLTMELTALRETNQRNLGLLEALEASGVAREAAEQRCKALEAERDDQHARILQLIGERDGYRHQAGVKWALRREIEQMLGIPDGPCSDPQLEAGVTALRAIVAERDRLKAENAQLRAANGELNMRLAGIEAERDALREKHHELLDVVGDLVRTKVRVARIQQEFADDLTDSDGNIYEQFKDFREQFYAEREEMLRLKAEIEPTDKELE